MLGSRFLWLLASTTATIWSSGYAAGDSDHYAARRFQIEIAGAYAIIRWLPTLLYFPAKI